MTFKKWLLTLMGLLVAADVAILLDIPVLRQVLGFSCFFTIPGLLVLYILRLNELGFLKNFVLSVGLSISFLIFAGLLINTLLPRLGWSTEPLSTPSLVLFFSLAIAILGFGAYWRNRDSTRSIFSPELGGDIKNKHLWLLLFPLLFPLLTVIGRRVMDTGGSNVILVGTFLLILLYVVLIMWQNKKMPAAAYPIAIGMISLALLLARGMMSNYLIGNDIYAEYHSFLITSQNLRWSVAAWPSNVTASLSVSLLPAILQSILKINPLYMFKVVLLLPISLTPVIGYIIYKKYAGSLYSFLAAFFFMAQLPFIYLLSHHIRLGISLISFSLAILVFFDDRITGWNKRILFLVFLVSLVVQYYVLPVIFLVMLVALWLGARISRSDFSPHPLFVLIAAVLLAVLIYFWWGILTATAFNDYILIAKNIVINLSNMFAAEVRGPNVTQVYTLSSFSLAMQIPGLIQRFTFLVIGIGVLSILARKEQRIKYSGYTSLTVACLALLVAMMILPGISATHYPAERLYLQVMVILAPAFIVGCQTILNIIGAVWAYLTRLPRFIVHSYRPRYRLPRFSLLTIFIGVMLVGQFLSTSSLYQELLGLPGREIFDAKSISHMGFYVYDSDVTAARWLGENKAKKTPVYIGRFIYPHCSELFEFTDYAMDRDFKILYFKNQDEDLKQDSYVFLTHLNVVEGQANSPFLESVPADLGTWKCPPLAESAHYFAGKNKIYTNGGAEIYR
ncbi:DUF2206 domain-containing protein [Chloroflexota bacterium]